MKFPFSEKVLARHSAEDIDIVQVSLKISILNLPKKPFHLLIFFGSRICDLRIF